MTVEQAETIRVVITDASVLINLTHTGHIPLLSCTPGYRSSSRKRSLKK